MASLFYMPFRPAFDSNGKFLPGAQVWFTLAGTNTPATVYTDTGMTTPATNPVVANGAGRLAPTYMDDAVSYRVRVYDADATVGVDTPLEEYDPYQPIDGVWDDLSLVNFLQTGTGAVERTALSKLRDTVSITDFGGVGDGVTNNRAALVAAVAAARGGRVVFPDGNFMIDTAGGSITLEEVELVGQNVLDGANASIDQGANIYIIGTANAPFSVRRGVSISGLGFYYPNQTDSAAPVSYASTFAFDFSNGAVQFVRIRGNVVYNAYNFVTAGDPGGNIGHVEITDNYICALNRGIYVRHNVEHLRIERNNFTFGHWLAATEAGARAYARANATAIKIDQSDGVEIVDNLFYGQLNGVLLAASGLCQFMNIFANKFDATRFPVKATGAGNFNGTISGNGFVSYNPQGTTLQGRSIEISTTGAAREPITISSNNFNAATEEHIYVTGNTPTRDIAITGNVFLSWAAFKAAGSYGAINANGTVTNITATGNSIFGSNSAAFSKGVVGSLNTAQLTGNRFEGCLRAVDLTVVHFTATGNRSFVTGDTVSDVIAGATSCIQTGNSWDKPSGTSTKPAFLARKSDAQVFNSGVATDVTWGTETFDKGGNFATPAFTAPVAGRYRFDVSIMHDASGTAGDRWTLAIQPSTAMRIERTYKMIADYDTVAVSGVIELAAGETVKAQITRNGGAGTFTAHTALVDNWFSGHLVE